MSLICPASNPRHWQWCDTDKISRNYSSKFFKLELSWCHGYMKPSFMTLSSSFQANFLDLSKFAKTWSWFLMSALHLPYTRDIVNNKYHKKQLSSESQDKVQSSKAPLDFCLLYCHLCSPHHSLTFQIEILYLRSLTTPQIWTVQFRISQHIALFHQSI